MIRRLLPLIAVLVLPGLAVAQEKLPDGAKVAKLDARPAAVKLTGPYTYSQILVTATLDTGEVVDVTRIAKLAIGKVLVSFSPNGLVRPITDGEGTIFITLADKKLEIPLSVTGTKTDAPVSFVNSARCLARPSRPRLHAGTRST